METHDKGLMEIGTKQTLLPVITNRPSDSLGYGLLNTVCDSGPVLVKLRVGLYMLSTRRREAGYSYRGLSPCTRSRRVDDRNLGYRDSSGVRSSWRIWLGRKGRPYNRRSCAA